jgi:hypothetical protein
MAHHSQSVRAAGLTTGLAIGLLAMGYHLHWRKRLTNWGATPAEVALPLAGDEVRADVDLVTTRAIAISAPPSCVWPWLVQMGSGRAGTYSYDWAENLIGLDMHSAEVILPQFQQVSLGDEFPLAGRNSVMRVAAVEPERQLAFCCGDGKWVSSYRLLPAADTTRLVSRNRIVLPDGTPRAMLIRAFMEPCWLMFERKMLLGIKCRAERLAHDAGLAPTAEARPSGWGGEHF